jgi:AraC-like DNA-binding protein
METKIRELLLLQLEMLIERSVATKELVEDADFEKLQAARLILDTAYVYAPTLAELSRKVSLNEFKLKKGFKACFGTTVKSYIIKLRMERAQVLFKSKAVSVSDVAYQCGYKDVSHFSAAFKAFYGSSPLKFKINWQHLSNAWLAGLLLLGI